MNPRTLRRALLLVLFSAGCGGGDPGPLPTWAMPATSNPGGDSGGGAAATGSSSGGASLASSSGGGGSAAGSSSSGSSSGGSSSGSGSTGGGVASDGGPVSLPPPRLTPDAFTGAPAYVAQTGNSPHNPGRSCMESGCHPTSGGGGDAPPFLIGGTVYQDYKGTIPAPGVEVRVVDSKGNAASVYSGTNGNFYINAGATVTFPAMVGARDGTTTRPMVTSLAGTMGSCAWAGCHIVGGSPSTGAYYPIHVP
jgi:hypothetical protein